MAIYICLIIFILLLPILVTGFCYTKVARDKAVALIGMSVIFLLLALKGDVGADILGYKKQYEIATTKAWGDFDYVYFEVGYITLTKFFSKLEISFQLFMGFVYLLSCTATYFFIRKYSENPTFSLIIFICYQFFVFNISGVRQCIAMSICLIAYMVLERKTTRNIIFAFLLNILAITMHQSAIIFLVALLFSFIKSKRINIWIYLGVLCISVVGRPIVFSIVNKYFREVDVSTAIELGGNFILLIGVALLMYVVNAKTNIFNIRGAELQLEETKETHTLFFTRMLWLSIIANIIFSGNAMLRAVMYLTIFIIPGLPNTVAKTDKKVKLFLQIALISFFILLFFVDTLIPNQLELRPYKFFWE